jgi:hypothetical protein
MEPASVMGLGHAIIPLDVLYLQQFWIILAVLCRRLLEAID